MYVNALWLGVLLTVVFEVVVGIIILLIASHQEIYDGEIDDEEEELAKAIQSLAEQLEKNGLNKSKNIYMIGIEEEDHEDCS